MDPFFVSVGNILDSADVRSTGALEPPDLVVTEMQRNRGGGTPHGCLTTPLGVFGRGLDSALMRVSPRAPEISCFETPLSRVEF